MTLLKTTSSSLMLLLCILPSIGSAYEVDVHRSLTENAVREYARLGGSLPISPSDLYVVGEGAVHEDEGHRPLNHFYDPIHNLALTKSGIELGLPSPLWAIDTQAQWRSAGDFAEGGGYFSGVEDYSWERAVYDYVHADQKRGLMALGQVLHLLEDATSPAHTRNDAHSGSWFDGDDPYETLTHGFISRVAVSPLEVPAFTTPEKAIQSTAYYTNTNFFSKDTVWEFELPKKVGAKKVNVAGVMYITNNGTLLLRHDEFTNNKTGVVTHIYSYPEGDVKLIASNWTALSRKAVTNGVGLIRLFEKAVENERRTHALLNKNQSTLTRLAQGDAQAVAYMFTGVHTSQTASTLDAYTPSPTPVPATQTPVVVDLATYFPNTSNTQLPSSAPIPEGTVGTPTIPSTFPEEVAYNPVDAFLTTPVTSALPVVPTPTLPPQQSLIPTTNPGNLSSLAFGSGAGGGGGTADIRQETAPLTDIRLESRSIEVPTCATNETFNTTTNTCVPTAPTCVSPQVLNSTNTCVDPAPTTPVTPTCAETEELNETHTACVAKVIPVTCTTPETRDTLTNTCILPTQTGPTLLPDTFAADTTLTYLSSPYTSKSEGAQTITIPSGITVTIEPGALLKLATETKIVVEGTLLIQGTATYPVTITSLYDDTVLPITNTDTALTPTAHPWSYIDIQTGGTLTASYTTLAYGGWSGFGASATVRNAGNTTLTHITIAHAQTSCLLHTGGTLTSDTLTVDTASTGLVLLAPQYDISHTTISHTQTAATLASLIGKITDTTGTDNAINALVFSSQNIRAGETAHLYSNTLSYYTESNHTIDGTLILHPGVFVQHADTRYLLTGTITAAEGEVGDTPVFTSLWDNALTGETRGTALPNTSRAPKVGDWFGVVGGTVSGVEVRYSRQ